MSLKLVTNSDVPTFMCFADIYMKLIKLWELKELVLEKELEDEFSSLDRKIEHYESLAQYHVNKLDNVKLEKVKEMLTTFGVDYSESSFEAHSMIPDIFGTVTMIHLTDYEYNLMFVHGLSVCDNYNEQESSFMMVIEKNEPFTKSIDNVVRNFSYLATLKTFYTPETEYNLLFAINQVCEYSVQSKMAHLQTAEVRESDNVVDCRELFLTRQEAVTNDRKMNKLLDDVMMLGSVIPLKSPAEDFKNFLNDFRGLPPTNDAG